MHVHAVLTDKGSAVITAGPQTSVTDIVALLEEHRIGAVVITGDGHTVAGVVAERDIVHALAESGAAALGFTADQVMERDVFTCDPDTTVESLMGVMTERRVRHIPVEQSGELAGLVSIGDVVKTRLSTLEFETEALQTYISNAH